MRSLGGVLVSIPYGAIRWIYSTKELGVLDLETGFNPLRGNPVDLQGGAILILSLRRAFQSPTGQSGGSTGLPGGLSTPALLFQSPTGQSGGSTGGPVGGPGNSNFVSIPYGAIRWIYDYFRSRNRVCRAVSIPYGAIRWIYLPEVSLAARG